MERDVTDGGREDATHKTPPAVWWRLIALGVLLGGGLLLWLLFGWPTQQDISSALENSGLWTPVVFAAGHVVATLLMLPKNILSIAAGLMFGMPGGALLVWASAMAGAGTAFWIGRYLGRDGVERFTGRHLRRLDQLVERHGVLSVLVVRLIPVISFSTVNYGCGVTAVRFPAYLLATAVGIVPGTVTYVVLGAYGTQLAPWQLILAVGALVALCVAGLLVARTRRHKPVDP
ncbi:TVP38/TMEM64 family protein [Phytoactinopolyspora mesophila]|uniref:TVP38/TMEM64 family membrane protein n=1 Tax=Phytoactinopolyspora mesophila TaxID=2650750 RepID=A0A7K3M004_9ACTN|nr:TVP38/TMEM64 family protein [Phytoactinopolyspora mesophila]NDL55788.1 TVP38/TMEM64 family protein [Phytoactinopolyspora mesophila]